MVMRCVFCEVGSDFLNINSVNLRLQNCNEIWDGVGRRMKHVVFFVCGLIGPSNVRYYVLIIL
jgi:hypothetical protein